MKDNKETRHRKARLRELVRECFGDSQRNLLEHIENVTGKKPNQGEISELQKDNSSKSFGYNKAGTLIKQIGLHRQWFEMPIGTNLDKSLWLKSYPLNEFSDDLIDEVDKAPQLTYTNLKNPRVNLNEVPKISWVRAGDMCETEDYYEPGMADEWVICPVKHGNRTYVLEVVGDSMNSGDMDGYIEGFDIFVDPDIEPKHGDDVIVRTPENKATFKRLQITDEGKYLLALNKTWPNRVIQVPEGTIICGVVIYSGKSRKK